MARLIDNEFTSYALSDEEQIQGSLLTITQRQVMQNHLAATAAEKIALEFDANNPTLFIQQEADMKGRISILNFILASSAAAEQEIINRNINPSET